MKFVNWKRFAILFALFMTAQFLSGCGSWVAVAQGLMPAIKIAINALLAFIGALQGKTISEKVQGFIANLEADISTELGNVSTFLTNISTNASQTVLQQIESAFQSIITNLNSILGGLNITSTGTVSKITNFVTLAVDAVEAVLSLIPLAMKADTLSDQEKLHADKAATSSLKNAHKVLQADYHSNVTNLTGEADVDLVLAGLPQTLP